MTQEEKAKAYDEALERANEYHFDGAKQCIIDTLEYVFPVLKESEDELTWLTKYIEDEAYSLSMDIRDNEDRIKLKKLQKACAWLERQCKRKVSVVDMPEPKFKVGDWITNGIETVQITGYDIDYGHQVDYKGNLQHRDTDIIEKEYHLWTIEDAKDGDVLVYGDNSSYHVTIIMLFKSMQTADSAFNHFHIFDDTFRVNSWCDCGRNAHPATKEQRDLLFQKMKEVGYEWDETKKELKKIVIHKWENGDIVRLKEDDGTRWQISKANDPIFLDEWFICQIRESGIAGGYVSTDILDTDYEFVTNPINDAQKEIDKEFDNLRKTASETTWNKNDDYLLCWTNDNLKELKDRYGEDYGNVGKCIEWIKSIKERIGGKELEGE